MPERQCSILIAEDQDIARLGLRMTLEKMGGIQVVGEAVDGQAAIAQASEFLPQIILMDIGLPKISGIEATKQIKKEHANIAIIMFTSDSSDESVFAALSAGADGYCLKNISSVQLRIAIDSVSSGAAWLDPAIASRVLRGQVQAKAQSAGGPADGSKTDSGGQPVLDDQQLEVLQLIGEGLTRKQIADQLKVPQASIEARLRAILGSPVPVQSQLSKHGVSMASLAKLSVEPGLILSDRFIIESTIGSGGTCTVYRGRDLSIGRAVAIKMLFPQAMTEVDIKRFLQEAKAASAINHPNVVTIFDFGATADGQPFIVMDCLDGVSLEVLINERKLSLARTVNISLQICDALAAAHEKGILHRDMKPSNVMVVTNEDGADLVKLVDFGMAKYIIETEDLKLTKTGELCGTPTYMSPEQFRGDNLDARTDIYALGCVLYEALSGKPPFSGVSIYALMSSHLNEEPSRLPFLAPGLNIPAELEAVVFKSLKKNPEDRPQSITEIKSVLSNALR